MRSAFLSVSVRGLPRRAASPLRGSQSTTSLVVAVVLSLVTALFAVVSFGSPALAEQSVPDPESAFTLCTSGTASGLTADHGYIKAYVPAGSKAHFIASGTVQPHPYFAGYWVAQGYLHLDATMGGTAVYSRTKLIDYYDNPLPPSIPFTYDMGTWTNSTGSSEPIVLDMWAQQAGLQFKSISYGVRVEISGNNGSGDLPDFCAGMPLEQTFGDQCGCLGSSTPYQHLTSRPVNTASGSLFESFTDVSFPGAGTPLVFRRAYNSLDTTAGPLGPGWTFGFNASLAVDAETGEATVRAEDGKQAVYRQVGGAYVAPPGVRSTLTALSGGGYRLTQPDGTTATQTVKVRQDTVSEAVGRGLINYKYRLTDNTAVEDTLLIEAGSDNKYYQNDIGLSVSMTRKMALKLGYQVRYNSDVQPGTENTDTLLTTNLVYNF